MKFELLCRCTARADTRRLQQTWVSDVLILSCVTVLAMSVLVSAAKAQGGAAAVPLPQQNRPDPAPTKSTAEVTADVWTDSEIADAKRVCTESLSSITAVVEFLPPIRSGNCGAPAPIRLISLGGRSPMKFTPPPTISCTMLVPLHRWIVSELQPAADRFLHTKVTSLQIMSSYACRTRYGRAGARMSEHAYANALDIGGFATADKRVVSVLKSWGRTRREIELAEIAHKAKIKGSAETANAREKEQRSDATAPMETSKDGGKYSVLKRQRVAAGAEGAGQSLRSQLGRESYKADELPPLPTRRPLKLATQRMATFLVAPRRNATPVPKVPVKKGANRYAKLASTEKLDTKQALGNTPQSLFLRSAHASACRIFGTTLGPEANDAHLNHFHLDLFPRRRTNYCE